MKFPRLPRTIRIPVIYCAFSVVWILVTDQINFVISPDVRYATLIAIIKGLFFVLASTFLIYILLKIDERQQKNLSNELQTMQESFSLLFANNPIPMWVNDQDDFKFLAVNDATCKLFGFPMASLLNLHLDAICVEGDRERVLHVAGKHFAGIQSTGPWRLMNGSGQEIQANLVLVRIEFAGRQALLITCIDLSRQKEIEESLKRTANERDAFESFSYSISHDLKANLRAVTGYSKLLLEDYSDKLEDQAKGYLDKMQIASDQMTRIIDNMLMLSQLTHASLKPGWVNLSERADQVLAMLQQQDPQRQVSVLVQPKLFAVADPELTDVILKNLLENAWKYTSQREDARIEFGCQDEQAESKVYFVKDNGIGFDVKKATQLFEPFQRFHPQADFPGSGIGLSIVAKIIQRHQGKIWAESEPGQGATFFFTLNQSE